jgi:hypothetical protein
MWSSATNDNLLCGIILLDLRKAFDLVNHEVLLEKLQVYRCSPSVVRWFSSYLEERKQATAFKGTVSENKCVSVGVPQGSILGPLMFILFMNDLPLAASGSNLDMYADDTTMTATGTITTEVQQKLNSQLLPVHDWCVANRMVINTDKTKAMLLTTAQKRSRLATSQCQLDINLGGAKLDVVKSDKLLGVIVDEDLTWEKHIHKVLKAANAHLALLRRIKHYLPIWSRKTFYNAFILPQLEYCCTIWGGGSTIDRISKFQKRAARTILNADFKTPSEHLFKMLKWMPVRDRIDYKRATLVYKSVNNLVPSYCSDLFTLVRDVNTRRTRLSSDPNKLYINPKLKKGQVQRSVAVSGAKIWNELDSHITGALSLSAFKSRYLVTYFKKC